MAIVALPRMTRPWTILVVAVAVFGFVWGYVGTAGSAAGPPCGSMGQCLQWTLDRGFPDFFYPAALVPGAGSALILGAVAYVLFLSVLGIRKAIHWERQPQVQLVDTPSPAQPALMGSVSSPVAPAVESHTPAPANASPTAVWIGRAQWARPTPLLLALGIALAWGILSVGPSRLAGDLNGLIPRDTVTAASCGPDQIPAGTGCNTIRTGTRTDPECLASDRLYLGPGAGPVPVLERDGMCHLRSGGDPQYLLSDMALGGQNGLIAFLAIGAALLLWPRLRAASQPRS
jgi:hypothetical protein